MNWSPLRIRVSFPTQKMDFRQKLREYQEQADRVRVMEAEFEQQRQTRLATLPGEFGYREVSDFIRAVRAAVLQTNRAPSPKTRRPRAATVSAPAPSPALPVAAAPSVVKPVGLFAATQAALHPAPAARESTSAPTVTPAPAAPTGTSLDDPANFGLLPDQSVLNRGDLDILRFREQLTRALQFSHRVLHTSKVPAAIWREWRQFEREVAETLRAAI